MRIEPRNTQEIAAMLKCRAGTINKIWGAKTHSYRDTLAKIGLIALSNLNSNDIEFLLDKVEIKSLNRKTLRARK